MKYLSFIRFAILVGIVTLSSCCQDDCDELVDLAFRAVDQSGRDLVLTLDVPVDSIKVTTSSGTKLHLFQVFAEPGYLVTSFSAGQDKIILSYEHRQTTLNITTKVIDKSRCCGDKKGVDTLEASSGAVSTETTPNGKGTIYVIKL